VAVFTAVSETFNNKNINTSVDGALQRFRPLVKRAQEVGLLVRGYVSTAFWCAFEGKIAPEAVVDLTQKLFDIGIDEVSISDTIGKAAPVEVARLLDLLLPKVAVEHIAVHFHDTYGRGIANVMQSWELGIRIFDASVGGLGGCPFAPGATGNVATESVVAALATKSASLRIDLAKLGHARRLLDPFLQEGHRSPPDLTSKVCKACEFYSGDHCCGRFPELGIRSR
jgi:hydroxymethylglutaryl-CoA lyase